MKADDIQRLAAKALQRTPYPNNLWRDLSPEWHIFLEEFARACEQHVLERVALATVAFNHPREALERLVSEIAKENEDG